MKKRPFGESTLSVSPLVFGGNVFGWTLDEKSSFSLLDGAVDAGINMIDTANVYSAWAPGNKGGESESIIGKWLHNKGHRDDVLIATKVGMAMGDGSKGLSKSNILSSVEASLKRLNTDYIDVYYAHADDPDTPVEETLSAFAQLIEEGKVRTIASSNYSADRLSSVLDFAKTQGLPPFIAHQPEYNLFDRQTYEKELEEVCQQNNLGVVTYFSLASGFLTGKYRTVEDLASSQRGKGFISKYMTDRGMKILDALASVADQQQVPMASVALAWIAQRPGITAPIASATSLEQLAQLAQAVNLSLSDADMALLNEASSHE